MFKWKFLVYVVTQNDPGTKVVPGVGLSLIPGGLHCRLPASIVDDMSRLADRYG